MSADGILSEKISEKIEQTESLPMSCSYWLLNLKRKIFSLLFFLPGVFLLSQFDLRNVLVLCALLYPYLAKT